MFIADSMANCNLSVYWLFIAINEASVLKEKNLMSC